MFALAPRLQSVETVSNANVTQPLGKLERPTTQIGQYTILAPIARSRISEVYLAEDSATGRRVAIKIPERGYSASSAVAKRVLAERVVSERVRHPGLLDVTSAGLSDGDVPYIVMEYLDGEDLSALADRGLLEIGAVVAVSRQVAAAVAALHDGGIVHCDLKPENIFVLYESCADGWPRIKVIDYGVAHLPDMLIEEDTIAGTPHYMAPEQWRAAPNDRSDVYALGCVMFELLVGDVPFNGSLSQLMTHHHDALAPRVAKRRGGVPAALDHLIARMLTKEPAMRPSMAAVEEELHRISMAAVDQPIAIAG